MPISFVNIDRNLYPKYNFYRGGLGYARKSTHNDVLGVKLASCCQEAVEDFVSHPSRRLLYGSHILTAALSSGRTISSDRLAFNTAQDRVLLDTGNSITGNTGAEDGEDETHDDNVGQRYKSVVYTPHNMTNGETILLNKHMRWIRMFLSDKWTKVMIINSGAGNAKISDIIDNNEFSDDSDNDEGDNSNDGECDSNYGADTSNGVGGGGVVKKCRDKDRLSVCGSEVARVNAFDTARFQHLNKMETLALCMKRSDLAKHVSIIFTRIKKKVNMNYMTLSETDHVYKRLTKCSTSILQVMRRMGKTASHVANGGKSIVMFPLAGLKIIYVAHDGNLTSNAFNTVISNAYDMVDEFNNREKMHYLKGIMNNCTTNVQNTAARATRRVTNGRNNTVEVAEEDFYLQAKVQKDLEHSKITILFKRYLQDGTCVDGDNRPYAVNWFKCRTIKEHRVSAH